jgi:hypothetical protein
MTDYSVGIVTFEHRFERFFKPLINKIKELRPNIEIVVAVNGEYKCSFNQKYRKEILNFISEHDNVFPNVYTEFRSLAKLWNNLLINSSNHLVLMLNDDLTITSENFFNTLESIIDSGENFFKINGSWSHTLLDRRVVAQLNWFDERFLGVGEEDGDMEWEIGNATGGRFIKSLNVPDIVNIVDAENVLKNIRKANVKYTQFNVDMAHGYKYRIDPKEGKSYGINPRPLVLIRPKPPLHTTESFYWENKNNL